MLVVNNNLTLANVVICGGCVSGDQGANGAGIRYQGGDLRLINDSFSGNQDGLLAFPVDGLASNTITIDHCTFSGNGVADPNSPGYGYTHNAYVGAVDSLTVTNSVFENVAGVGHELKSRAYVNTITDNIIADGTSSASYSIDLPNGGQDLVQGNSIEQGANSQNGAIIHFGGEGFPYADSSLTVNGNIIQNDLASPTAIGVLNQTILPVTVSGNVIIGLTGQQIAAGPVVATDNVDGQGKALPDSTSNQILPSNVQIFTDAAPHRVTLSQSNTGVEGGAGLLSVTDPAGHVIVLGGIGGLVFTEQPGAGGSTIYTVADSTNTLSLQGQDSVDSRGNDRIIEGAGNVTVLATGRAQISSGSGSNTTTVNGVTTLVGGNGSDFISVGQGGTASVIGREAFLEIGAIGGAFSVAAVVAGTEQRASASGGSVGLQSFAGALNFTTSGGLRQGARIDLGIGRFSVVSDAADTIRVGAGTALLRLVGGGQTVFAGTGALSIFGAGIADGCNAVVYGNGGTYVIGGDTGNITYVGGPKPSTLEAVLSNITIEGGRGLITVDGGARDVIVGGSGGLLLTGVAASSIVTAMGSQNTLTLGGGDTVQSWGTDVIDAGSANQTITAHGAAQIVDAWGNDSITLLGRDTLVIDGGSDAVVVGRGATVAIATDGFTTVSEAAAEVSYSATGTQPDAVVVTGGQASIQSADGSPIVVQTQAASGTVVSLSTGPASVISQGADTIRAGAGADTIDLTADGAHVFGATGSLSVTDSDWTAGHVVTVVGGSGAILYNGGGPGQLRFIGGAGSATIDGAGGALSITGGTGSLAVSGGSGGPLQFVGGSGAASIGLTSAGGVLTLGSGVATVTEAGWGGIDLYRFTPLSRGAADVIEGFRLGVDKLAFQGVSVQSQHSAGGSTLLGLSDGASVELAGVVAVGSLS